MCFSSGPSAPAVPPAPIRNIGGGSASSARITALAARGVRDTIATTALGDTGYGTAVRKPTFLGATAPGS
jgi:hypothetical protein